MATPEGLPESLRGGTETIAALATIPGRSALAIVRLTGPDAALIGRRLSDPWPLVSKRATLSAIKDPRTGRLLDRGIVVRHDGPHSFTGEDVVEITSHGGSIVPASILAAMIETGARLALPGEFTRRALLNGRMDLSQAEAVLDLIDARSSRAQGIALEQLDGGLSRRVLRLRSMLLDVEALIAYEIDFPEEDHGPVAREQVIQSCDLIVRELQALRATAHVGEIVREGAVVVLAGVPNAGKSSLFNALLGRSRAIVSEEPGTTRDAVEAVIEAGGWSVRLVDTAGLRRSADRLEHLGVEMSEQYVDRAAVVLLCGDSIGALHIAGEHVRGRTRVPCIAVRTKSDLGGGETYEMESELVAAGYEVGTVNSSRAAVIVSAETGHGLPELVELVVRALEAKWSGELDAPILVRERHRIAVTTALEEVELFREVWRDGKTPAPIAATHVRSAIGELEDVIGAVGVEDILDRVFSAFCIGK